MLTFLAPVVPYILLTLGIIAITIVALVVLKFGLSWLLGKLILWAQSGSVIKKSVQKESTEHQPGLIIEYFPLKIKGAVLDTVEITPDQADPDRPYVIHFSPNAMSYHGSIDSMRTSARNNQATVIGFDYPNVGASKGWVFSESALVNAGIAQVDRLLTKGVSPEQITLNGLSLGGAVATLVAAHFHSKKTAQKINVINDRSFAKITSMVPGGIILEPLAYLLNWRMDAHSAWKKIPDECKELRVSKDDGVIPYKRSSLYQAIKADLKKQYGYDKNNRDSEGSKAYKDRIHHWKISDKEGFGAAVSELRAFIEGKERDLRGYKLNPSLISKQAYNALIQEISFCKSQYANMRQYMHGGPCDDPVFEGGPICRMMDKNTPSKPMIDNESAFIRRNKRRA